jgi:hypothetical protein
MEVCMDVKTAANNNAQRIQAHERITMRHWIRKHGVPDGADVSMLGTDELIELVNSLGGDSGKLMADSRVAMVDQISMEAGIPRE